MIPGPHQILSCPNCQTLYSRETWLTGDNSGYILWSDGSLTDDEFSNEEDPVVPCVHCKNLFVVNKARIPNKWGYQLPKDKKFYTTPQISIDDCLKILAQPNMVTDLGEDSARWWYNEWERNPKKEEIARNIGEALIRIRILRKLNDLIRFEVGKKFSSEQMSLFKENASALLPVIPLPEDDPNYFLIKAELHRNRGEFFKSLKVLARVNHPRYLNSKWKMILLNLLRIRKLVYLSTGSRKFKSRWKRWKSWIS